MSYISYLNEIDKSQLWIHQLFDHLTEKLKINLESSSSNIKTMIHKVTNYFKYHVNSHIKELSPAVFSSSVITMICNLMIRLANVRYNVNRVIVPTSIFKRSNDEHLPISILFNKTRYYIEEEVVRYMTNGQLASEFVNGCDQNNVPFQKTNYEPREMMDKINNIPFKNPRFLKHDKFRGCMTSQEIAYNNYIKKALYEDTITSLLFNLLRYLSTCCVDPFMKTVPFHEYHCAIQNNFGINQIPIYEQISDENFINSFEMSLLKVTGAYFLGDLMCSPLVKPRNKEDIKLIVSEQKIQESFSATSVKLDSEVYGSGEADSEWNLDEMDSDQLAAYLQDDYLLLSHNNISKSFHFQDCDKSTFYTNNDVFDLCRGLLSNGEHFVNIVNAIVQVIYDTVVYIIV
jgi:hypothetical protein